MPRHKPKSFKSNLKYPLQYHHSSRAEYSTFETRFKGKCADHDNPAVLQLYKHVVDGDTIPTSLL